MPVYNSTTGVPSGGSYTYTRVPSRGNATTRFFRGVGTKAQQVVHQAWEAVYGRRAAQAIGKAAVDVLQSSLNGRCRSPNSVWKAIGRSLAYRTQRHKSKGLRRVVITVSHIAAMQKQYGGFVRARGPKSQPSAWDGRKSKFVAIRLKGNADKRTLGERDDLRFDAPKGTAGKISSMPLANFLNVSKKTLASWQREMRHRRGILGSIGRAVRKGTASDADDQWFRRYLRKSSEEGQRQYAKIALSDWQEASDDLTADDVFRSWTIHPRYGDLSMPDKPSKGWRMRDNRFVLTASTYLKDTYDAVKNRYGSQAAAQYRFHFMTTTRVVFERIDSKTINPLFLLVRGVYIPPTPWLLDNTTMWKRIRNRIAIP